MIYEPADNFDPDAHAADIDEANGWKEPGEKVAAATPAPVAEQLAEFAKWLAPAASLTAATPAAVGIRALALCWMSGSAPCVGLTQRALADAVGVSRASISRACRDIEKATGVRARGMRSLENVQLCRASMQQRWRRRRVNDNHTARASGALRTEPGAQAWLQTFKRQWQRAVLVEVGRLPAAPLMHAALLALAAAKPTRLRPALRIVRLHRTPAGKAPAYERNLLAHPKTAASEAFTLKPSV